ncbi:diaminopropionate ammonia-lyase [Pigmentiphaga soli]|uniref:Diaminopropionate ammonia-lyase n=1 Tax=Pigmentiphaga soli TaxID=1007095 RepID=A0ABP8GGN2_9BURK
MLTTALASRLFLNPRASHSPYADEGRDDILSLHALSLARAEIQSWEGYQATPLRSLRSIAHETGVKAVFYKDESQRFGLGSFKALGGAYAVFRLLQAEVERATGARPSSRELIAGKYAELTRTVTVACATDGNHGRSVAWGASLFHCQAVIYVHGSVSTERVGAIAAYGARVDRIEGNYDNAVSRVAQDAARMGWHIVSDTSYEGYVDVPRDVMQGYGVMIEEAIAQAGTMPTHIFVQGGVGGVAASTCAYLWERFGARRSTLIVVEPETADCLFQSAMAGRPTAVAGELETIMAGLACGVVSLLAWKILDKGADAFMTISDAAAADCMRRLAAPREGDPPVVAGESAVAGLAGFFAVCGDPQRRAQLGLDEDSTVLFLGTEGATDRDVYKKIVGAAPEDIDRNAT